MTLPHFRWDPTRCRKISGVKNFANIIHAVAWDGDAAVDGRIKPEVIISGIARSDGADAV